MHTVVATGATQGGCRACMQTKHPSVWRRASCISRRSTRCHHEAGFMPQVCVHRGFVSLGCCSVGGASDATALARLPWAAPPPPIHEKVKPIPFGVGVIHVCFHFFVHVWWLQQRHPLWSCTTVESAPAYVQVGCACMHNC